MTLFMDMGLGLKKTPPNMKIFQNWNSHYDWDTKKTLFMDMGLGLKNPPRNMKIIQDWNSH